MHLVDATTAIRLARQDGVAGEQVDEKVSGLSDCQVVRSGWVGMLMGVRAGVS